MLVFPVVVVKAEWIRNKLVKMRATAGYLAPVGLLFGSVALRVDNWLFNVVWMDSAEV